MGALIFGCIFLLFGLGTFFSANQIEALNSIHQTYKNVEYCIATVFFCSGIVLLASASISNALSKLRKSDKKSKDEVAEVSESLKKRKVYDDLAFIKNELTAIKDNLSTCLQKIVCPNCNKNINYENDFNATFYCPYCGSKFQIDTD